MTKRILVVIGTRPEAIKMAPVVYQLKKENRLDVKLLCTGQHKELIKGALDNFNLDVDFFGDAMLPGQNLVSLYTRLVSEVSGVLSKFKADLVLVHGDTATAFSAAFAAFLDKVPVGHVEAGLRTADLYSPFPEEGNRRLIGSLAAVHFAPTPRAKANLLADGIQDDCIFVTGNTVIDALLYTKEKIKDLNFEYGSRNIDECTGRKKILAVTLHRRENLNENLISICDAFEAISLKYNDVKFVWPVHKNPVVFDYVQKRFADNSNFSLIEPLDYVSFVSLLNTCYLVLTDSGGIQEEAPSLNKPVVILRNETERPEVVESGAAFLAGADKYVVRDSIDKLLSCSDVYEAMASVQNPFGDGSAAKKIRSEILKFLSK